VSSLKNDDKNYINNYAEELRHRLNEVYDEKTQVVKFFLGFAFKGVISEEEKILLQDILYPATKMVMDKDMSQLIVLTRGLSGLKDIKFHEVQSAILAQYKALMHCDAKKMSHELERYVAKAIRNSGLFLEKKKEYLEPLPIEKIEEIYPFLK